MLCDRRCVKSQRERLEALRNPQQQRHFLELMGKERPEGRLPIIGNSRGMAGHAIRRCH